MSAGALLDVPAGDRAPSVGEWRRGLLEALAAGERLVTLFGRPDHDQVCVTAVCQAQDGALRASRVAVSPEEGFHTLVQDHPPAHVFERELHEQCGVRVRGHPWLKPVRFENGADTDAYPFLQMHGKQLHEVQVGPIHAGVIEPGAFRFLCHGEVVHHLEIHLGYQHRGIERKLLALDPWRAGPLVEVVAGDASVAHAWAWASALESLSARPIEPAWRDARGVMLELERVGMHLAGLSGMALDIGFLQGATTYGRLRTTAINASMRLCGSRFGRTAVRAAGNGVAWDTATRDTVLGDLAMLSAHAAGIDERFLGSASVLHRLRDCGRVATPAARDLGLVGPAARASGLAVDQRTFARPGFAPVVRTGGDCLARAEVRIHELHASLALVRATLEACPVLARASGAPAAVAGDRLVVAVVEGWRGEVVHALETGPEGRLVHHKVQDPSLRNWMGLALALRGEDISDFPINNKSFDLSYCGNDL